MIASPVSLQEPTPPFRSGSAASSFNVRDRSPPRFAPIPRPAPPAPFVDFRRSTSPEAVPFTFQFNQTSPPVVPSLSLPPVADEAIAEQPISFPEPVPSSARLSVEPTSPVSASSHLPNGTSAPSPPHHAAARVAPYPIRPLSPPYGAREREEVPVPARDRAMSTTSSSSRASVGPSSNVTTTTAPTMAPPAAKDAHPPPPSSQTSSVPSSPANGTSTLSVNGSSGPSRGGYGPGRGGGGGGPRMSFPPSAAAMAGLPAGPRQQGGGGWAPPRGPRGFGGPFGGGGMVGRGGVAGVGAGAFAPRGPRSMGGGEDGPARERERSGDGELGGVSGGAVRGGGGFRVRGFFGGPSRGRGAR